MENEDIIMETEDEILEKLSKMKLKEVSDIDDITGNGIRVSTHIKNLIYDIETYIRCHKVLNSKE